MGDARQIASDVTHWLWKHVVTDDVYPRELPPELAAVFGRLQESLAHIEAVTSALRQSLVEPNVKFFSGRPLARWEYHLLAGEGVWSEFTDLFPMSTPKAMGLSPVDDFEAFSMACYEDENQWRYINPHLEPEEPMGGALSGHRKVGMRFGAAPEELDVNALRPEQQAFFEEYRPDIYARFRRGIQPNPHD